VRVIFGIYMVLVMLVLPFSVAKAEPPAIPATCDEDFWGVMDARAWMEGKREMEVAQRLILKPDSVLEYSCFAKRGQKLQNVNLFGKPERSFDLRILVSSALNAYINNNFGHKYGGGSTNLNGTNCSVMGQVWDALKCVNLDKDMFIKFEDVVDGDPRNLPEQCDEPGRADKWNAAIGAVAPEPKSPPESGGVEKVNTFLDLLNPNCSAAMEIPTGVLVTRFSGEEVFPEVICSAPGCTYNGSNCAD